VKRSTLTAAAGALLSLWILSHASPASAADGLKIPDGLWRTTSTVTMPMLAQPQSKTEERCMKNRTFSPTDMTDQSDCTVKSSNVSGDTMSWTLECPNQAGTLTGQGRMMVSATQANGEMKMSMTMNGQSMTMTHHWEGQRIGDCP